MRLHGYKFTPPVWNPRRYWAQLDLKCNRASVTFGYIGYKSAFLKYYFTKEALLSTLSVM